MKACFFNGTRIGRIKRIKTDRTKKKAGVKACFFNGTRIIRIERIKTDRTKKKKLN
jgi:uncharacterized small protein (DUF1192 family)